MRSFHCYCTVSYKSYIFFSAKLVLKRVIQRRIAFKSYHIDESPTLAFFLNFTVGLEFYLRKGWEMGFTEHLDSEMGSRPPPHSGHSWYLFTLVI
jgi:hypothetical protein